MFGNLTDKFFCMLLGILSVFILVLQNTQSQVTERFMNVPLKPEVQKIMRTKCNGQVVEVAVPSDYAAQMTAIAARQNVIQQT